VKHVPQNRSRANFFSSLLHEMSVQVFESDL
jgi:hypothetical protein